MVLRKKTFGNFLVLFFVFAIFLQNQQAHIPILGVHAQIKRFRQTSLLSRSIDLRMGYGSDIAYWLDVYLMFLNSHWTSYLSYNILIGDPVL